MPYVYLHSYKHLSHTNTYRNKLADKIYCLLQKKDLTIIDNMQSINGLFHGKLSSVSNLVFMKSLPYLPFLLPFIVPILFLIPSQSSVYFFNTSFFSFVQLKTKYLLPFSLQYVHLFHQLSDAKDSHYEFFHNHQSF